MSAEVDDVIIGAGTAGIAAALGESSLDDNA
jgi:thioredoxin reductase